VNKGFNINEKINLDLEIKSKNAARNEFRVQQVQAIGFVKPH